MQQFFYTVKIQDPKAQEESYIDVIQSVNVDSINRCTEYESGKLVLALNDWHKTVQQVKIELKNGGYRVEPRDVDVCSEIMLNLEDSDRFRKLFEIK